MVSEKVNSLVKPLEVIDAYIVKCPKCGSMLISMNRLVDCPNCKFRMFIKD